LPPHFEKAVGKWLIQANNTAKIYVVEDLSKMSAAFLF
jgi:hypothetical protein